MEGKVSPPGAQGHMRASSNCSFDLPPINIKKEPIDSEEENRCSNADLLQRLREWETRANEAEDMSDKLRQNLGEWIGKANIYDNQRIAAEQTLQRERAKAKSNSDAIAGLRAENAKLMDQFQQATHASIAKAQLANEAQANAGRFKNELDQVKHDLLSAQSAFARTDELLKVEKAKKEPDASHMALQWKYAELERENILIKKELENAKSDNEILKKEKKQLEIDVELASAATPQGMTPQQSHGELMKRLNESEEAYNALKSLMGQISQQEKTAVADESPQLITHAESQRIIVKNVENQRTISRMQETIDRLQEENADLSDRVDKLDKRLKRNSQPSTPFVRADMGQHHNTQHHSQQPPQHAQYHNRFSRPANAAEAAARIADLQAIINNYKKTLGEASDTREMLERDKEELRALLKQSRDRITVLETDCSSYSTSILELRIMINDLKREIEKNSKDAKEGAEMREKVLNQEALIQEMEEETKKKEAIIAKERQEMEEEIEELKDRNWELARLSSNDLRKKLKKAEEEIEELRNELSKAEASKERHGDAVKRDEKGKKIIVEEIPPPPFTLRATAIVAPPPEKKEKGWKRGFQPVGAPSSKRPNTGARDPIDQPVEHNIFDRPLITAEVRDKIKFKLHSY